MRRALVAHTRMPAFDRDSGSQDVDNMVHFLLRAGWQVTFLAREEAGVAEERHAHRLRQMGVATHAGFGAAERLFRSNSFDLALIAFWELAAELGPKLRRWSPATRLVVSSMDIHFLRKARRAFGTDAGLDATFGAEVVQELNTYHDADAVLAVSDGERDLLADFLGMGRVFTLPLAEQVARSTHPLDERRGMCFVGNFRHLPNREALEYLCAEVLPLLDPELLDRHPLTVLGNWLDRVHLTIDPGAPGVNLVGWVPSVQPYLERSRLAVVPLLHGAGVKRKVIQAMMAGTPVVTTPVGAEGLDLVQGVHALIAADAADLGAGVMRLLTEDDLWHSLSEAGATHVEQSHSIGLVERRFGEVIESLMARRPRGLAAPGLAAEAVRHRVQTIGSPGSVVLVVSGGDEELVDLGSQPAWPFPQGDRDRSMAGYEPVDGAAAVNHLEAQRGRGARYFVLPRSAFGWRHRYPELFAHLERTGRRVHQDEHLAIWDLAAGADPGPRLQPTPTARVLVRGTYPAHRTGPPPGLLTELAASTRLVVDQRWLADSADAATDEAADADADYILHVRDDAILPAGFLDDLIATQATLGVARLQPAHTGGPGNGRPITERQLGTVAREVDEVTALPVLSVRAGEARQGPTALADNLTVGLRDRLPAAGPGPVHVRRTWVAGSGQAPVPHRRAEPLVPPRISVLIATYERPALLRSCLAAFAEQTLDRAEYEVVVVDDGSENDDVAAVLEEAAAKVPLTWLRIAHAGRSAAKNHAVLLARAPIVLFFDDDDRPAPDYLARHLAGHDARPDETVAILGHTDWAPELPRTPLMRYVTDVDRLMFAYERLAHGQELDWRGFWEGRISCKRSFLTRHGLHDQRLDYSIDIELAWRLMPHGLRVVYDASAVSVMARPIDLDGFCERTRAKGRAHAIIGALHRGTAVTERLQVDDAAAIWEKERFGVERLRRRIEALEVSAPDDGAGLAELHASYRELFRIFHAQGVVEATEGVPIMSAGPPTTVRPFPNTDPDLVHDGTPADAPPDPSLSVSLPVWSRTPELAEMAQRTIERIWEVARVPTEVIAIDNGSPCEVPLDARVYRYDQNRGVSVGWNTGIRLSRAPVVAVINSDCRVEPGWDEALHEAATDGRRVAFPYTDHCDGLGFARPDQGGTAGWCFMMTRVLYDEVGVFDEWFSPAFLEDTDYWHRAWQLGVELSPVPAARVVHARRTSQTARSDMLLQAHRYKYGWKHDVDPHRAPPYYNREIVDYHGRVRPPHGNSP